MKGLNIYDYLFHGITSFYGNLSEIEGEAKILRSILDTGGIFSREKLKSILPAKEYRNLRNINWNGKSYVSIATPEYDKYCGHYMGSVCNNSSSAFETFVKGHVAIVLNPKVLKELPINLNPTDNMPGEIQVRDFIPFKYFEGITIGEKSMEEDNLFRLLDCNNLALKDLRTLAAEKFVCKYYKRLIIFRKIIKDYGLDWKLYYTDSGEEVESIEEKAEFVRSLKRKF